MQDRSHPKVAFAPRRLAHANIFVSSHARSVPFYRDICGLTEVFQEPGIKAVFFSNGSSHHDVALMETSTQPRIGRGGHVQISTGRGHSPGLNHLGFEMENERELVDAYERASAAGVQILRTTDHGMSHSIYLFDPDGNLLEFYADAIEDWQAFYRDNENQLISGGWNPRAAAPSERRLYQADFVPARVPGAAVHPRQIESAALVTADFGAMLRFYRDVAGLGLVAEGDGYALLSGALGSPALALQRAREGARTGLGHVTFSLMPGGDLRGAQEALGRAGVPVFDRLVHAETPAVVVRDPDGLELAFIEGPPAVVGAALMSDVAAVPPHGR